MIHGWLASALRGDALIIGLELVILGFIASTAAHLLSTRCRSLVYAWATHGGWEIVQLRRCFLFAGNQFVIPGLPVYRVELRSRSGRERVAFVRIGNLMFGALSDELDIEWAETAGR